MIRAILVDDEPSNLENLSTLLARYCPQVEVVGTAQNIKDAQRLRQDLEPNLIFLDIQLNKELGFELLRLIPHKTFEVIFVTAFDHYGINAVKFAALDYLLKPVDIEELKNAVDKAQTKLMRETQNKQLAFLIQHLQKLDQANPKIALPQQHEIRYLNIGEIIRCQADNTYTHFYLQNGECILISKALKEYADLLQPHGFIRTHQSHLVNPAFVKSWLKEDGGTLLLTDDSKIPISKPNRENVKNKLV
ncbi:LytR/AlgR family response regulator transcription factor [Pedobacter flavus]|uniref:LytTR family DNA-binding domain-containing protein n=1 Tax=Pedobacter flavus TaxID=3113906 RepID=A0ABU7GZ40_9SPHI|nr:LytTR family DNA-binding domain-containing protein [Pedobacter sp. VNH31]MEE1884291.1 LytTR family DNA-binding domain-containing protein [Pedobacter sp. VNH31]